MGIMQPARRETACKAANIMASEVAGAYGPRSVNGRLSRHHGKLGSRDWTLSETVLTCSFIAID